MNPRAIGVAGVCLWLQIAVALRKGVKGGNRELKTARAEGGGRLSLIAYFLLVVKARRTARETGPVHRQNYINGRGNSENSTFSVIPGWANVAAPKNGLRISFEDG
jgi:hypothetical protein